MSLIEIIGELLSPGPTGGVKPHPRDNLPATWIILARAAISVAGLTALLVWLGIPNGFGATLACLAYVLIATVLQPTPDYSNIGWFGGLMDNPFRISDDVNRLLVLFLMLLFPGRVIGSGLILLLRYLAAAADAR